VPVIIFISILLASSIYCNDPGFIFFAQFTPRGFMLNPASFHSKLFFSKNSFANSFPEFALFHWHINGLGYGLCRNYPQPLSIFSVRKNTHFLFWPMHPPRHGL